MHLGDNPYIVGIVLTVLTHSGPHIVYSHERATPLRYLSSVETKLYDDFELTESDIDWEFSSDEEEAAEQLSMGTELHPADAAEKDEAPHDQQAEQTEMIFGFEAAYLAEMLSPPRSMCNKRFQLSIEDKIFFGVPIHVDDQGQWSTAKQGSGGGGGGQEEHAEVEGAPTAHTDEQDSAQMSMFHVCFVLDPPITEYNYVCDELYEHVLSQFVSLLRHEQKTKNYVWSQITGMIKLLDECDSVGDARQQIENRCELAKALRALYESISRLEIAQITINGKLRPFQIPVDVEVHRIPMFVGEDSLYYGCQPTTVKQPSKETPLNCPDCYGLLLLDDPEKIIKKIEADPSGALAALIHKISPLQSMEQMAKDNNIPLKQLINLAHSLVYWRCASIIIPLSHRFIYGVSPLAPLGKFEQLNQQFRSQFSMITPLARLLSSLSTGKPQQFSNYIPSRDHQAVYMDALAWAMRHHLVVHLQTFALIFVPRKIKLEVVRDDQDQNNQASSSSSEDEALAVRPSHVIDNVRRRKSGKSQSHKWEVFDTSDQFIDSFVLEPSRASLEEKKWIYKIASKHSPEAQQLFYRLSKYLNGKDCLEQAFMHEKISRTDQRKLLQEFSEYLVTYRHF